MTNDILLTMQTREQREKKVEPTKMENACLSPSTSSALFHIAAIKGMVYQAQYSGPFPSGTKNQQKVETTIRQFTLKSFFASEFSSNMLLQVRLSVDKLHVDFCILTFF
jgi:hypothetical protein